MHQDQLVDMAGFQWPCRFLAKHADIGLPGGPGHHALRPRHQPDHPPCIPQIRTQQRYRKAIPSHRLAFRFGPEFDHLIPNGALRRTAEAGAIIEIAQIDHVKMH